MNSAEFNRNLSPLFRKQYPINNRISTENQWLISSRITKKSTDKRSVIPVTNPVEYFSKTVSGLFEVFSIKLDPDQISKSVNIVNLSELISENLKAIT